MRQKTQTRTAYMHLLDGYPAVPGESGQIRFVGGPKYPVKLSDSIAQIRREQRYRQNGSESTLCGKKR